MLVCCPGLCHLYLGTKADTLVPAYDAQAHVKGKRDFVSKHELVTSNWNDLIHIYLIDQSKLHGSENISRMKRIRFSQKGTLRGKNMY